MLTLLIYSDRKQSPPWLDQKLPSNTHPIVKNITAMFVLKDIFYGKTLLFRLDSRGQIKFIMAPAENFDMLVRIQNKSKQKGFSVAELLIVLFVIAIIAMFALPQIMTSRRLFRFAGVQRLVNRPESAAFLGKRLSKPHKNRAIFDLLHAFRQTRKIRAGRQTLLAFKRF